MCNAKFCQRRGIRHRVLGRLLALWVLAWSHAAGADGAQTLHLPAADPMSPSRSLAIHAALDMPQATPLIKAFHRRYPQIDVRYRNMSTLELYQGFLRDPQGVDVVISSAMPWQFSLANDGHARALAPKTLDHWPEWAQWRRELVAFTFEPVVMVYHRKLTDVAEPPTNHARLLSLLQEHQDRLRGRVATYDPAESGAGYSYAMEDARLSPRYRELVAALGGVKANLETTTSRMLEGLASGRYWLGYNLLGSYARAFVDRHPQLEYVIPDDYALVVQRLAFIADEAPHPQAAERFMRFLVSRRGQQVIDRDTTLGAVHPAVVDRSAQQRASSHSALRPMELDPQLLAALDRLKRRALLSRWQRAFQQGKASPAIAE